MSARKAGGRRQRRNTADLEVIGGVGAARQAPPPPHPSGGPKLLAETVDAWDAYWRSDVAGAVVEADMPALVRLFRLYDDRERLAREARRTPLVVGSQGQPVLNPLRKELASLDGRILALEDRLGITPKARLGLGLQATGLRKSVEELNRAFAAGDDDEDGLELVDGELVDDDEDPRRAAR